MIDEFNSFEVSIESDVASQDFDKVDLYGDIIEDTNTDSFGDDIEYE